MYKQNHLDTYGLEMKGILNACKATRKLKGKEYQEFVEVAYNYKSGEVYTMKPHAFYEFCGECDYDSIFFTAFTPMTMQEIANAIMFVMKTYEVE